MRLFPIENAAVNIGVALTFNTQYYKPSASDGVLVYLNANPNVQLVLDKIKAAGGKIVMPKTKISPEYGFMAMFIDTEVNRITLDAVPAKYL